MGGGVVIFVVGVYGWMVKFSRSGKLVKSVEKIF